MLVQAARCMSNPGAADAPEETVSDGFTTGPEQGRQ